MRSRIFLCAIGLMLAFSGCSKKPAANPAAEAAAVSAAVQWLGLVDGEQYEASWEQAAEFFRNAITKDQWAQAMNAGRKPLGSLLSRAVSIKSYTTTVPGAPDGEYVIIQFKTSFANKASSVETVTPMKQADGSWKVSGYYIK